MQENKPYIRGKHRKIVIIKWKRIIVFIFLLCISACVMICALAQGGKYIEFKEQNFYFLQMGEFASVTDAAPKVLEVQGAGGAGYVYNASTSKVMASVYSNQEDAASVCIRLNSSGQNVMVFAISAPRLKINAQKTSELNLEVITALNYPSKMFNSLYNTILQLDKKEISSKLAILQAQSYASSTEKLMLKYAANECIALKSIGELYDNIYFTLKKVEDNTGLDVSVKLKLSLCELAANIAIGYSGLKL